MRAVLVGAFLIWALDITAQEEPIILVENGRSQWHIVPLDGDSAMSTGLFVQAAISKLSGVSLPISDSKRGCSIVIGTRARIKEAYKREERMFTYEVDQLVAPFGDHICIAGDDWESLMWPAREFLMYLNGTEMLAPGVISFRHVDTLRFGDPELKGKPAFSFRMPYYSPARDHEYSLWNGIDQIGFGAPRELHYSWGLWVHTMHRFVPPAQFDAHPEYFAERNGTRVPD